MIPHWAAGRKTIPRGNLPVPDASLVWYATWEYQTVKHVFRLADRRLGLEVQRATIVWSACTCRSRTRPSSSAWTRSRAPKLGTVRILFEVGAERFGHGGPCGGGISGRHSNSRRRPTSGSWLNQVERFFAAITEKRIRRGIKSAVEALEQAI